MTPPLLASAGGGGVFLGYDLFMNTTKIFEALRFALYCLTASAGAVTAGYLAIGDGIPSWLIFTNAALQPLAGGFALKHFSYSEDIDTIE